MSVLHFAVADDYVFAGTFPQAAVVVTSALDGDTVVAGVEEAVFDQYSVARFGVASVAVRTVVVDVYATHNHVL